MYFIGLLTAIILSIYSIEKMMVITHSAMFNNSWCLSSIQLILSRATNKTGEYKNKSKISKIFPRLYQPHKLFHVNGV